MFCSVTVTYPSHFLVNIIFFGLRILMVPQPSDAISPLFKPIPVHFVGGGGEGDGGRLLFG